MKLSGVISAVQRQASQVYRKPRARTSNMTNTVLLPHGCTLWSSGHLAVFQYSSCNPFAGEIVYKGLRLYVIRALNPRSIPWPAVGGYED